MDIKHCQKRPTPHRRPGRSVEVTVNPIIINEDKQAQGQVQVQLQAQIQAQRELQAQLQAQEQEQAQFQAQLQAELQRLTALILDFQRGE